MKVNYKKFSKHAEKMVKSAGKRLEARPILQGIFHDSEGNLAVTDAHRMYYAREVNAPKGVVLHAITGAPIESGTYPNIGNLLPQDEPKHTLLIDELGVFVKALKAMQQTAVATGEKKDEALLSLKGESIELETPKDYEHISFSYKVDSRNNVTAKEIDLLLNLSYLLEALEMMLDMGVNFIEIDYYGKIRPLSITPAYSDQIQAIILPVRRGY